MPTRGPIADGYLDEVFTRRAAQEAMAVRDETRPRNEAVRNARKKATGRDHRKRTGPQGTAGASGRTWSEVSVTLEERQVQFVDSVVETLRFAGVRNAGRQQVVRTLIDALEESSIDFSRIDSLEALRCAVCERPASPSLLQIPQAILDASLNLLRPRTGAKIDLGRDRVPRR